MKNALILLSLLMSLNAANYRSVQGASGKYGTVTLPNTAPFNNLTAIRFEFRLHSWTGTGRIAQVDGFVISKAASTITATNFYETGSPTATATIPGSATDIIVRAQRITSPNKYWSLELWTIDGTRISGSIDPADAASVSIGGDALGIMHDGAGTNTLAAELAWFRVYSTAVGRNQPMPTNIAGGDILDYEFEGNGTDASANAANLTMTGSPTYTNTPVAVIMPIELSAGVGRSFTPTCGGTAADSYAWTLAGVPPLGFTISDSTVASPTVTVSAPPGQYTLRCTVAVNGVTATRGIPLGLVATNAAGVVIVSDAVISNLLGPQLRDGVTGWSWYDEQRRVMGDYWISQTSTYTANFTSTEAENYYDSCLVQYQNYYRTGLTRFQTAARACADKWYSQYWQAEETGGTCGTNWIAPRNSSFLGLVLRAYEAGYADGSARWTCLTAYANYHFDLWVETKGVDNGYTSPYFGIREGAYAGINAVAISVAHPNSSTRSAYAARVTTEMTNYLRGFQCLAGDVRQACTDNYSPGAGTISISNGGTSVTGTGTAFTSVFSGGDTIALLNDTDDTSYFLTISTVNSDTSITLSAPFAGATDTTMIYAKRTTDGLRVGGWRYGFGESADLGGFYDQTWHSGIAVEWAMRAYFAGITQSLAQSITTDYQDYLLANARVYPSQTCTGYTPPPSVKAYVYSNWGINGDQGVGDCDAGVNGVGDFRAVNNLLHHVSGFAYLLTGTSSYLTRGDEVFASNFGAWIGAGADEYNGLLNGITGGAANGKFYGQSLRASGAYLAHRLGSSAANTAAVAAQVSVGFTLIGVPSAAKIRLTATLPNGSTASATCTSSPCVVTGLDTRQGNAVLLRTEYLSSGDAVLAAGEQQSASLQ